MTLFFVINKVFNPEDLSTDKSCRNYRWSWSVGWVTLPFSLSVMSKVDYVVS